MKRLLNLGTMGIAVLVLAACSFPSQRLYKVTACDRDKGCGFLPIGSELALVKESQGEQWRLWYKTTEGIFEKEDCGVVNDEFRCGKACGDNSDFVLRQIAGDCDFDECVEFNFDAGNKCPEGGQGTGGGDFE